MAVTMPESLVSGDDRDGVGPDFSVAETTLADPDGSVG
jgi:hypothetical protein